MTPTIAGELPTAARQRLAVPSKLLWAFLVLLLIGPGEAAGQAFVCLAKVQHHRVDIPELIHTFVLPSNPSMTLTEPSKGMFLIAGRGLLDPSFAQSVVLLVDVNNNGALGLIINRATEYKLAETIPELQEDPIAADLLYLGGPVGANTITLLMRSEEAIEDVHHVFNDVYFSTSIPVLEAALEKLDHEQRLRVYAGHAGWGAGQLQDELKRGDWHLVAADAELLFNTEPERIWLRLIRSVSGLWVQNSTNQGIDQINTSFFQLLFESQKS
ncbi:MAG: hypothetical protein DRQ59_14265 [Gammaproteobacteria bacterium]|nr:MAG: hypothetical protein DRQ59_14265 [Gammaproteobacteria bacterium]